MSEKKHILSAGWTATLIALAVILVDQIVKIWVKTHFYIGESVEVLPFFELRFVQNNGMAFGMEFGSKLFLTLFRIVVVGLLIWYLVTLCRKDNVSRGYVAVLSLICAGAMGNIFDCVFYGEIFSNPMPPFCAQFVEWGHGYAGLFHGLVVDMLYFPLFSFTWPEWLPLLGGKEFSFFDPVFNVADSAITVGIIILILFYSRHLPFSEDSKQKEIDSEDNKDTADK